MGRATTIRIVGASVVLWFVAVLFCWLESSWIPFVGVGFGTLIPSVARGSLVKHVGFTDGFLRLTRPIILAGTVGIFLIFVVFDTSSMVEAVFGTTISGVATARSTAFYWVVSHPGMAYEDVLDWDD